MNFFAEFKLRVVHVKGCANVAADFLSRGAEEPPEDVVEEDSGTPSIDGFLVPPDVEEETLLAITEEDLEPKLEEIRKYLLSFDGTGFPKE